MRLKSNTLPSLRNFTRNTPDISVNLFYQPEIAQGIHHLDEEESRHCVKVLRRKAGDALRITDGKGYFYEALITKADPRQCEFSIQSSRRENQKAYSIHIAVSPTKNADRIEWFVEKATEFGVDTITLLDCENAERTFLKTERLRKITISAMKQSLKATLPVINDMIEFKTFVGQARETGRYMAYVDFENPTHLLATAKKNESALVLIGPEGDFSKGEVETAINAGFVKVSLGKSRLRTETAAIAACHILNLVNV